MDESFLPYRVAALYLNGQLEANDMPSPLVGVICGSGLSGLSNALEGRTLTVPYADIPGFPAHCAVQGHVAEVVFGLLSGIAVAYFRGRFHSYEGYDMKTTALPVTVMRCMSIKAVIITNAAGGLNRDFKVGDVVCVNDHLAIPQLAGKNPLIGPNDDELGPRFPPTSNAYSEHLRAAALKATEELGFDGFIKTHGTYSFVSGPMYESKAECRFLHQMGGDCVGMSTVPEVVAAHHCSMKVLCLSLVTEMGIMVGDEGLAASHEEILEAVAQRSEQIRIYVQRIVQILGREEYLDKLPASAPIPLEQARLQYDRINRAKETWISSEFMALGASCFAAGALLATVVLGSASWLRHK